MKIPPLLHPVLRKIGILLLLLPHAATAQVTTIPAPSLPPNARLAICGDSITEQMLYTKYVEIYLRACAGRSDVSCFQFGWGGENAAQFPNRIRRGDLDAFGPTAVTFLYGANDVGGMAWDASWMAGMWTGRVNGILDALANKYPGLSAKVVCSPTFFDANSPGANAAGINQSNISLGHCRDIGRSVAVTRGASFSDVRQRMLESGTAARVGIPGYYFGGNDGVHAGPNGHLMIAHEVLKALNCDGAIGTISVNFAGSATVSAGHAIVSASGGTVVIDSSRYPFCTNYNGSTAADRMATILPYLPFSQELNRFMLVVSNLSGASANVTWGGTTLTFSKAELEAGVNLAAKFPTTPFDSKFASVMALIEAKQQKEQQMIKAAGDATASVKGWTAADVAARNALDANVAGAITAVRHTITIAPVGGGAAPVITGTNGASGTVGTAFSFSVTASNLPTGYAATGLPAGLTINASTGLISGTPGTAGTSTVLLSASNGHGTGTSTLTITVSAAQATPVVTSALAASGTVGAAFSHQITATNNPTKYYATGLPAGLSLNSTTGAISGAPSAAGTTNVLISAENAGGDGTAVALVLTISAAGGGGGGETDVLVDEFSTATAQYGTTLTNSSTVGGVGLAPSGVNLPGGTWQLAGGGIYDSNEYPPSNPYVPGVSYATGHNGGAAAITLGGHNVSETLTVRASLSFSGSAATGSYALVGFYSAPKTAQYQSLTNQFSGLKVNYDGSVQLLINGSASGNAVAYGGSFNPAVFSNLTYTVNTTTGGISGVSLGSSSASYSFSTSGFTNAATAYAGFGGTMGNSPAAVVFDRFKVSKPGGGSNPPAAPVVTSSLTASGAVGSAFSYQISASNSPTTYSATGLPGGLSLNATTGAITGTPSAAGTSNVLISAGNAGGAGPAVTLVLTITTAGGGGTDIVSDDFSTATAQYGTTLTNSSTVGGVGLAPSGVNLPGGTWQLAGGGIWDSNEYPASNPYVPGVSYATGHNGGAAAISLGSYNLNRSLTVRASLLFSGSAAPGSFALVGFYMAPKTGQYQSLTASFSGLRVNYDGSVQLYQNGVAQGAAVAYGGTYNPAAFAMLTFTVDTNTGSISGVSFGTSSAAYPFSSTGFGNAATAYAGFGGTMGNSPSAVVFDTFEVSTP